MELMTIASLARLRRPSPTLTKLERLRLRVRPAIFLEMTTIMRNPASLKTGPLSSSPGHGTKLVKLPLALTVMPKLALTSAVTTMLGMKTITVNGRLMRACLEIAQLKNQ